MNRKERIIQALNNQFSPTHLVVEDESSRHAGHAGARPEGETHYKVVIESPSFANLSRVKSHQMIYAALEGEFSAGLHALAIEAKAG